MLRGACAACLLSLAELTSQMEMTGSMAMLMENETKDDPLPSRGVVICTLRHLSCLSALLGGAYKSGWKWNGEDPF